MILRNKLKGKSLLLIILTMYKYTKHMLRCVCVCMKLQLTIEPNIQVFSYVIMEKKVHSFISLESELIFYCVFFTVFIAL